MQPATERQVKMPGGAPGRKNYADLGICVACKGEYVPESNAQFACKACVPTKGWQARVRGILCRGCNMVVSRFEDEAYAMRVAKYLLLGGDLPYAQEKETEDLRRL